MCFLEPDEGLIAHYSSVPNKRRPAYYLGILDTMENTFSAFSVGGKQVGCMSFQYAYSAQYVYWAR